MRYGLNTDRIVCNKMKESMEKVKQAKYNIESALLILACTSWSGKTRRSFEDVLQLSEKIHDKFVKFAEENNKYINDLYKNAENYIDTNKTLKKLEK